MIHLVIGPNGSGKSEFAEGLAVSIRTGDLVYIATMVPTSEECHRRIRKHRKMREGKGFETYETSGRAGELTIAPNSTVLLEDVSNLLANCIFCTEAPKQAKPALSVMEDISSLAGNCANLICVSIGGLHPEACYDESTNEYIRQLNMLNQMLWDASDEVTELQNGNARQRKGSIA